MPQHISRKELKKDEIRETLSHGAEAIFSHQHQIWVYGGIALLVVLAVLGWRFYTQNPDCQRNGRFGGRHEDLSGAHSNRHGTRSAG